jgi:O-antigen/teichoic acid export membrane protein
MNANSIKHIVILLLSAFAGSGLTFLLQAFLARWLTLTEFGDFSAALSVVFILAPLAGLGISSQWLKFFGEEGYSAKRWLPSSYRLLNKSIFIVLIAYYIAVYFVADAAFQKALLFLSLLIISQILVELVCAKLQLEEKYSNLSWFQTLPHILRVFSILILFLITGGVSYHGALLSYLAVSIVISLCCIYYLSDTFKNGFSIAEKTNKAVSNVRVSEFDVLSRSYLFCVAALLHLVMFQGGLVLLKFLGGALDVAIYNAAFMIIVGVYLIPTVIYQKYLQPKIHHWASFDAKMYVKSYRMGLVYMFFFGLVIALLIYFSSELIINLIFGEKFHMSIRILEILCIGIPIRFMATCSGAVLNTRENIKIKVILMAIVALCSVLLAVVFIPRSGAVGVCYSFLISETLLVLLYALYSKKVFS